MSLMLSKTYDALTAAGAPEEKAREAAEELASYDNHFNELEVSIERLTGKITALDERLTGKINIVYWMLGLIIIAEAIPFLNKFFG